MMYGKYKNFLLLFLFLAWNISLIENSRFKNLNKTKSNIPKELSQNDEEFDKIQSGNIPYLSYLTLKVSYFQEKIKNVKNYQTFKMWETKDDSFRVNIVTFPTDNPNKEDIVIFFRGTEAWRIKNVISDFNLKEVILDENCKDCLVQQGYLDAFLSVEKATFDFIKEEIRKLKVEGKEINNFYFSGHSLGGAMAEIATHKLLNLKDNNLASFPYLKDIEKISLITFGAPKIGNRFFVERMEDDQRIFDNIRVVYGIDEVPFFPPEKFFSQSHNGDLIYFRQRNFKDYNIIVGFNRGNKKKKGLSPKEYLENMNLEQRGIMNIHERILDHLKYAGISKQILSNAIDEIRNMQ